MLREVNSGSSRRRVAVIGLDSASPELIFEQLRQRMPNLSRLIDEGLRLRLRSCVPPITVPAWMVMFTGKGPGSLGIIGFRHREDFTYEGMWIADSTKIRAERVWDILGRASLNSCVVAVPPSYPPRPLQGWSVGCFLTPDTDSNYTYPAELKEELVDNAGEYITDVDFRVEDEEQLLQDMFISTETHFEAAKYLARTKPWDFFAMVEIGTDRIQHAFWKYYDPGHHLYSPGNAFESAIPSYYSFVDDKLGELIDVLGDDVITIVTSDHGVKRMKGAFCINEFLKDQGLLEYEAGPGSSGEAPEDSGVRSRGRELKDAGVDWTKTKAWAWGGYYSRVYINLEGREAQGVVPAAEYESFRRELADLLREVRGPGGEPLDNKVYTPEELYGSRSPGFPDLMVFFDDLSWQAAGTVGHGTQYLMEDDKLPHDAVHDWDGIFIMYDPRRNEGIDLGRADIVDVAPTILRLYGLDVPADMEGRPIEALL